MAISPEKQAGLALAALLADDRDLQHAGPGLEDTTRTQCAALLTAPTDETREQKTRRVADLLARLRPELGNAALQLPANIRRVLAGVSKRPLRGQLLEGVAAGRVDFVASPGLQAVVLRAARNQQRGAAP